MIISYVPYLIKYNIKVYTDILKGYGPLSGIHSGLSNAKNNRCFFIACDMPFVGSTLIRHMLKFKNFDAVVPKLKNTYEPLFACYSKKCLPHIRNLIDRKKLRIIYFFNKIKLKIINQKEVKFSNQNFININTKKDLEKYINLSQ